MPAQSAVREAERGGRLEDRFGLSWQLSPADLHRMMVEGSSEQLARVTEAFLAMKRFDVAELRRAHEGDSGPATG